MTHLIVVGSVALDTVETPFEKRIDILGGSGSFFAVTASLLLPVGVVAVIGDDFPEDYLKFFGTRQIDLSGLERVSGRTFRWSGRYLSDMVSRETLDTQLNVFERFSPKLPLSYTNAAYLFLANIHPSLQLNVLDQIVQPKFIACDTMNFWISGQNKALKKLLPKIHLLMINDEEARQLGETHNLLDAVDQIRAMGPEQVIIKRGDAGALLFDKEGIFWAPAFPLRKIVDPTGAGDSFAGGFMSFLAASDDLSPGNVRKAMIYGSAVASFSVEDFSLDRFRNLNRAEVLERCQAFQKLVAYSPISLPS